MRVCLVAPPSITGIDLFHTRDDLDRYLAENVGLGVLTLAAILEDLGITCDVQDLGRSFFEIRREEPDADFALLAARRIAMRDFDLLGVGSICSSYPATLRFASEVKRLRPDCAVILGGPQASVTDIATLEAFPAIDLIVRGEADLSFIRSIERLSCRQDLASVPGLTWRGPFGICRNPNAPPVLDLDSLPLPAFSKVPGISKARQLPIEIGRGCPFSCTFCSTNDFFRRKFRLKSARLVISQMSSLRSRFGVTRFDLTHDMFTVDRRAVMDFCGAMRESGEPFQWTCSARTDCVDEELIDAMAQAGCVGVFFGVETGSPRMQKVIDKELDIDEAKKAVRWCGKRSVRVTAATIVGFPEEEECDLHATLDFLFEAAAQKHVVPQISFLAPLAGTPVYAQYKDRLEFSGAQSTFSHQGFPQGPAEIGLIAVHPGIFQNFYAAPTRLPREFVQEAALFLTWALHRCRWLSIALAHHLKGPLALCRKWTDFRPRVQSLSDYYSSPAFHYDMVHFASAHQARSLEVEVLAEVQRRLLESADADPDGIPDGHPIQVDAIPSLAPGTAVFTVAADPYAVIDSLAAGVFGDHLTEPVTLACGRTPAGSQLYRLTPALARLLSLCDGKRDAESIAQTASLEFRKPVEALDAPTGWLVVLEKARQCGLVRFQAGVAQKRKPRKSRRLEGLPGRQTISRDSRKRLR